MELIRYPLEVLLANLAKIPARTMAVYLDACFSGESEKGILVRSTSGQISYFRHNTHHLTASEHLYRPAPHILIGW